MARLRLFALLALAYADDGRRRCCYQDDMQDVNCDHHRRRDGHSPACDGTTPRRRNEGRRRRRRSDALQDNMDADVDDVNDDTVERSLLSPRVGTDADVMGVNCIKDHTINGCCNRGTYCVQSYSGKAKDAKDCYKSHGGHRKDYGACEYSSGKCECWSKCQSIWHPKKSKGKTVCYEPHDGAVAVLDEEDSVADIVAEHTVVDQIEDDKVERSLLSPRVEAAADVMGVHCDKDHTINGCCAHGTYCKQSYSGKAKDAKDCYKSHGGHKKDYGACEFSGDKCECWSKCKPGWHSKKSKGHTVCYEPHDGALTV